MGVYVLRGEFPIFFWMQDHAGRPGVVRGGAPVLPLRDLAPDPRPGAGARHARARPGRLPHRRASSSAAGAGLLGPPLHHRRVGIRRGELHPRPRLLHRAPARRPARAARRRALARADRSPEPARCRVRDRHGARRRARPLLQLPDRGRARPAPCRPSSWWTRACRSGARAWLGVGAFLLGSLPFWVYNLTHDWATVATGARFQGRLVGSSRPRGSWPSICLPVVLGVRAGMDQPAHLPGPLAWTIPVVVGGAVLLLLARVVGGPRTPPPGCRDRRARRSSSTGIARDPGRGLVRRVRPRPALPPAPDPPARARPRARGPADVALDADRRPSCGSPRISSPSGWTWLPTSRRCGPRPGSRYRQEREADARLFALAPREGPAQGVRLRLLARPAPHLRGAAGTIIVAEPFNDRHPPHTPAVDRSPRPAYVVQAGVETFRAWMEATRITSREEAVGQYRVFYDFTPPPDVRPLPRARPSRSARALGRGDAGGLLDAPPRHRLVHHPRPERAPRGSRCDLGAERMVSGLTLVNDRAERVPDELVVMAERAGAGPRIRWPRSRPRASRRAGRTARSGSRRAGRSPCASRR